MLWASLHPIKDVGQDGVDAVWVVFDGEFTHGEVVVEVRGFDQGVRGAVELVWHDDRAVVGVGEAVGYMLGARVVDASEGVERVGG